jgi:hypothetical protein
MWETVSHEVGECWSTTRQHEHACADISLSIKMLQVPFTSCLPMFKPDFQPACKHLLHVADVCS